MATNAANETATPTVASGAAFSAATTTQTIGES
jgi:hypothetical protein